MTQKTDLKNSRREFLKKSGVLTGIAVGGLAPMRVHAAESGPIKIGLIGCGGRGCGAVVHAMTFVPDVKLVAVCDVFPAKTEAAVKTLKERFPDRVDVADRIFVGFDAYKSLIPHCDVVFNCTPQHFRPMTMKATIEGGKHAFCEKPVAVDATGIRSIMESAELAKEKGLNIVTGLISRYAPRVRDCVARIKDGQIGDVVTVRAERSGALWMRTRTPEENEMEYQMKNWVNFNWLASEYINDVTIHQLDTALWCMGDELIPASAHGVGGRIVRTNPDAGDLLDTMSIVYEYEDGRPLYAFSHSISGNYGAASTYINGTKGRAEIANVGWGKVRIYGQNPYESAKEQNPDPYLVQHTRLFDAIRSGGQTYVNDLPYTAKATMAAILGRMVTHSGQKITWQDALNAPEDYRLKDYSWDATPPTLPGKDGTYPLPRPGAK